MNDDAPSAIMREFAERLNFILIVAAILGIGIAGALLLGLLP